MTRKNDPHNDAPGLNRPQDSFAEPVLPLKTQDESFFTPMPVPPDAPEGEIGPFLRPGPLDWITDPGLYAELSHYADRFDAAVQTGPELSFPMFCLRRFAPYPLHRLTHIQLLHFVDNLWTHLMPEIPWSWSQLFVAWLSGDVPPSARWFLDRLVDCAGRDARNPAVAAEPVSWTIGACRDQGCSKSAQEDFVFAMNRGRVWFCMVSDGVSRSTIGSGEDASLGVEKALNSSRRWSGSTASCRRRPGAPRRRGPWSWWGCGSTPS